MNLFEFYPTLINSLEKLTLKSERFGSFPDRPNYVSGLLSLRSVIYSLDSIPILQKELQEIYSTWLFDDASDTKFISNDNNQSLITLISLLKLKILTVTEIIESSDYFGKDNLLYIKLPELNNFEDLSKTSSDLKRAIELPVIDPSINGEVKILAGDQGSVILYVSIGTVLAVKLVAALCWSSYVLKRKKAECRIFEAHAKTLELKNESLQILIDAQSQQMKNLLSSEAEAIALKHYSHNEPETVERLKLSITSIADLVERGAKILPMNTNEDIQKLFPDSNQTLIESSIKQIAEGA